MTLNRALFLRLLLIHASIQFIALQFLYEVKLKVSSGLDGRLLTSLKQDDLDDHLVIEFPQKSKHLILDVYLNDDFENDTGGTTDIVKEKYRNCDDIKPRHYNGKIRGRDDSVAELVICEGITGSIRDNDEIIHFMSVQQKNKEVNLNDKQLSDTSDFSIVVHYSKDIISLRKKRETKPLVDRPYTANSDSRYIELALVIEEQLFTALNMSEDEVYERFQRITNQVNALFQEFNVFVAVVDIEIWNSSQITVDEKSIYVTLENFTPYVNKTMKDKNFDSMILMVHFDRKKSQENEKSLAFSKDNKICNNSMKAHGVVLDDGFSDYEFRVTKSIANVLGYNLGIESDDDAGPCPCPPINEYKCKCSDDNLCIMTTKSYSDKSLQNRNLGWSNCSKETLKKKISDRKILQCINDIPTKLFHKSSCGNSFKEIGEACDIGLVNVDKYKCCDSKLCTILTNECRPARDECDLPEICDGESLECPKDAIKSGIERCTGKTNCLPNSHTCNATVINCNETCNRNGFCDSDGKCHCFGTYDLPWCRNNEIPPKPNNTDNPNDTPEQGPIHRSNSLKVLLNILVIILAILLSFCVYYTVKKSCCKKSHHSQNDLRAFYSRDNPSFGRAASETPPQLNASRVANFSQNSQYSDYPFSASDEHKPLGNRQERGNNSSLNYATLTWADRESNSNNVPRPNNTVYATINKDHEVDAFSMPNFANAVLLDNSDVNPEKKSNRNPNLLD